jgi:hypothetical protein
MEEEIKTMDMEIPEEQEQITVTEEELKQIVALLNTGVVPVSTKELDHVIKLLNILATTIDKVYDNKTLGREDFQKLEEIWDQAWLVKERYDFIEKESRNLGLFDKISLVVKGFTALNRLFKSIKKARA